MLEDDLVDAQDEREQLETLFLTALRHIVNLEAGFTGPMPEREAREAVARTFIGGLWRNSCKHKDSPLQLRRASLRRADGTGVIASIQQGQKAPSSLSEAGGAAPDTELAPEGGERSAEILNELQARGDKQKLMQLFGA